MKKPNIVIFHSHDMGRWIQPYGHPIPTPHLQTFADEALTFRKAFCAAPTCSPSRAAMLTGCAPHCVNVLGLVHRGFGPVDIPKHLAQYLRGHGYHTMLAGIQHEIFKTVSDLGYSEIINGSEEIPRKYRDIDTAEKLAARLQEGLPDQPLFLSFGTFMPHREFPGAGPENDPERVMPPYPVSDTPEGRRDFAEYREAVGQTDKSFGILIAALKKAGIYENTILVVTTDHGPAFPGMKCSLQDTGIGVAFMIRQPNIASGTKKTSEALVSQLDLFPTLCELADLPLPEWLQGHSLVPVLKGEREEVRDELFAEVTYHASYQPMRAIRTRTHKLIRHFDPERLRPVLANVDNGHEKERLLAAGWEKLGHEAIELFDLETDPWETKNRAGDPVLAEEQADLLRRLEAWMKETNDPLLASAPRVKAPPGARVNALVSRGPEGKIFE